MNTNKWFGIDMSNEISLLEYGLLVREIEKDSFEVIYRIGEDSFDVATITNTEVNYLTKESWFNANGFFSFLGMTSEDWYECDIANKISDLLAYYGYENILGASYGEGQTVDELVKNLNVCL